MKIYITILLMLLISGCTAVGPADTSLEEYSYNPKSDVSTNSFSSVDEYHQFIRSYSSQEGGYYGYVEGCYAKYRRHGGNITSRYSYKLFRDQLMTCYLSLVRFRGRYLLQWGYYFFHAVLRRLSFRTGDTYT